MSASEQISHYYIEDAIKGPEIDCATLPDFSG
jgi:hypothetical protein